MSCFWSSMICSNNSICFLNASSIMLPSLRFDDDRLRLRHNMHTRLHDDRVDNCGCTCRIADPRCWPSRCRRVSNHPELARGPGLYLIVVVVCSPLLELTELMGKYPYPHPRGDDARCGG